MGYKKYPPTQISPNLEVRKEALQLPIISEGDLVLQHNEFAGYEPSKTSQISCWNDLLPHQKAAYKTEYIIILDT
jgi:hypothetical protein